MDEGDRRPAGFLATIYKPFAFCAWSIGFVGFLLQTFVRQWLTSRPFVSLAWGVPAVVAAVAVGILAANGQRSSLSNFATRYRIAAAEAAARGDTKATSLWLEKITLLDPNDPALQFGLAMAAEKDGRLDRVRQIMDKIAPEDRAGYPDAHFWVVQHLMEQDPPLTPELRDSMVHHLTHAVGSERFAPQAHALLGQLLLQNKDVDAAIPHLEEAVKARPELGVGLGLLYDRQGKSSPAKTAYRRSLEHFKQLVQEDPKDTESRLRWVHCEILLKNLPEAERALKEGLGVAPDPRLAGGLGQVYMLQFDRLWSQGPEKLAQALPFLQAAVSFAPNDPSVLRRLSLVAEGDDASREAARELLQEIVAQGKAGQATATAHIILGIIAGKGGDLQSASVHYQLALKQQPRTMEAMNNLAWTLAHTDPPELDRALGLAEAALAAAPDHPEVLETRGQILPS